MFNLIQIGGLNICSRAACLYFLFEGVNFYIVHLIINLKPVVHIFQLPQHQKILGYIGLFVEVSKVCDQPVQRILLQGYLVD